MAGEEAESERQPSGGGLRPTAGGGMWSRATHSAGDRREAGRGGRGDSREGQHPTPVLYRQPSSLPAQHLPSSRSLFCPPRAAVGSAALKTQRYRAAQPGSPQAQGLHSMIKWRGSALEGAARPRGRPPREGCQTMTGTGVKDETHSERTAHTGTVQSKTEAQSIAGSLALGGAGLRDRIGGTVDGPLGSPHLMFLGTLASGAMFYAGWHSLRLQWQGLLTDFSFPCLFPSLASKIDEHASSCRVLPALCRGWRRWDRLLWLAPAPHRQCTGVCIHSAIQEP